MGIAWMGQSALIGENDFVASTRNYVIAIVILILSLLHSDWNLLFKRGNRSRMRNVPNADSANSGFGFTSADAIPHSEFDIPHSTVPVRRARSQAIPDAVASPSTGGKLTPCYKRPLRYPSGNCARSKWEGLRARLLDH